MRRILSWLLLFWISVCSAVLAAAPEPAPMQFVDVPEGNVPTTNEAKNAEHALIYRMCIKTSSRQRCGDFRNKGILNTTKDAWETPIDEGRGIPDRIIDAIIYSTDKALKKIPPEFRNDNDFIIKTLNKIPVGNYSPAPFKAALEALNGKSLATFEHMKNPYLQMEKNLTAYEYVAVRYARSHGGGGKGNKKDSEGGASAAGGAGAGATAGSTGGTSSTNGADKADMKTSSVADGLLGEAALAGGGGAGGGAGGLGGGGGGAQFGGSAAAAANGAGVNGGGNGNGGAGGIDVNVNINGASEGGDGTGVETGGGGSDGTSGDNTCAPGTSMSPTTNTCVSNYPNEGSGKDTEGPDEIGGEDLSNSTSQLLDTLYAKSQLAVQEQLLELMPPSPVFTYRGKAFNPTEKLQVKGTDGAYLTTEPDPDKPILDPSFKQFGANIGYGEKLNTLSSGITEDSKFSSSSQKFLYKDSCIMKNANTTDPAADYKCLTHDRMWQLALQDAINHVNAKITLNNLKNAPGTPINDFKTLDFSNSLSSGQKEIMNYNGKDYTNIGTDQSNCIEAQYKVIDSCETAINNIDTTLASCSIYGRVKGITTVQVTSTVTVDKSAECDSLLPKVWGYFSWRPRYRTRFNSYYNEYFQCVDAKKNTQQTVTTTKTVAGYVDCTRAMVANCRKRSIDYTNTQAQFQINVDAALMGMYTKDTCPKAESTCAASNNQKKANDAGSGEEESCIYGNV